MPKIYNVNLNNITVGNLSSHILSKYSTHNPYLVTEVDPESFPEPATGYSSNSYTTTQGTIFDSGFWGAPTFNRRGYKAFRNQLLSTVYGDGNNSYTSADTETAYIGFEFNEYTRIKYAVVRFPLANTVIAYPLNYKFQASNDNITWIDKSAVYNPPVSNDTGEIVIYPIENPLEYKYYRLYMNGGSVYSGHQYVHSLFLYT